MKEIFKYRFLGTLKHTHSVTISIPFDTWVTEHSFKTIFNDTWEFISKRMKIGRKIKVERALLLESMDLSLNLLTATFWLNFCDLQFPHL